MADTPVSIFISYARKDQDLMRELESHLEPLKLSCLVKSWYDGCISPGEEWEPQIKENLGKAQVILLLISVDFIKSRYCYDVELTTAIERHKAKDACVIPVILRSCMWKQVPVSDMRLGDLQALPSDARPISKWSDRDEAFTNIAEGIFSRIQRLQQEQQAAERQHHETESERQRQAHAEAQRQWEETEYQRKRAEYYNGGLYYLENDNYPQAVAYLRQAEQYGHPDANRMLAEAKRQHRDREAAEQRLRAQDELKSEKGIDYTYLRDLLKTGDWQAADRETYEVMIGTVGKKSGDYFTKGELLNFPCADLLTIDRLWVKYSGGKFGFSVQQRIYVECGAKLDGQYPGDKIWARFGDLVGWRRDGMWILDVTFDTKAAEGHLPLLVGCGWNYEWCSLLSHPGLQSVNHKDFG
ncbi:MAG: GUN4 domain-containing protein [Cyanobacteria bacterium P01_F01_bin.86]